jgi:hypothetical protein
MLQFCHGSVTFPPLRDRGPDVRLSAPCHFSGPVRDACCMLTGIDYGYTDGDHHVWRTVIRLDCRIDRDVVTVVATFGFRDSSGNWDDRYDGTISFCVVADVLERPHGFISALAFYGQTAVAQSAEAAQLPVQELPPSEAHPHPHPPAS